MEHVFKIVYKPGKFHLMAYALSRFQQVGSQWKMYQSRKWDYEITSHAEDGTLNKADNPTCRQWNVAYC